MLPISAYFFLAMLSLAFVGAFTNTIKLVWAATLGAAAVAFTVGMMAPLGLVPAVALAVLCYLLFSARGQQCFESRGPFLRAAAHVVFILAAIVFLAHLAPGFKRWVVAPQVMLSPHSALLDVVFHFDKPLFAIFVLAFGWRVISPGAMTASSWKIAGAAAAVLYPVVFGFAYGVGTVRIDVKMPEILPVWALGNLVLSTVAEEVFFRGYVQQRLAHVLRAWRFGAYASLAATSLLFGLAHVGAGPLFALAAVLAGIGYGWVYWRTQSIVAASMIHLGLNVIHFTFFTYPMVGRT